MIGSIAAEFRKLRQRPALLVSVLAVVGVVALVYTVSYLQATHPTAGQRGAAVALSSLYPAAFVTTVISIVPGLLSAIAIVLGALMAGTEYQWGTVKAQLIQGPGRLTGLFARFVMVAFWMALLTAAFYASAAAGSVSAALLQQQSIAWPAGSVIIEAAGATWLIIYCYAMLGTGLGFVFRQSAAALGVGLIYVVLIQTILVGFLGTLSGGTYKWVTKLFDGQNADSLIQSFGSSAPGTAHAALVGPTQAALVIAGYIVFFGIVSAVLVRRRDIA